MDDRLPRKLAAILYADVAGYSRLTGADEDATHRTLSAYLDLIASTIHIAGGQVMHYAGDAVLARFDAVVDAVCCATDVQFQLATRNADLPDERKVEFRIGVNLGDVIEDRGDIYGDGVNVAARLESLATPGGICISEAVRTALGGKLDLDYESLGEQQVKNIAEPVKAFLIRGIGTKPCTSIKMPASASSDRASIVILPFKNMSSDPENDFFAEGIGEEIMTILGRYGEIVLAARGSAHEVSSETSDPGEAANRLGVNYALSGSVRRAGDRVRIVATLVDGESGRQVWSETYDHVLDDIFEVQDEVAQKIVATLVGKIERADLERSLHKEADLSAYECVLRGRHYFGDWKGGEEDIRRSREMFEKAIELDPRYAAAYSGLASAIHQQCRYGWTDDPDAAADKCIELARKAIELDARDSFAYLVLSSAYWRFKRNFELARSQYEKAVELNPNYYWSYCYGCWFSASYGDLEASIVCGKEAIRRNPLLPDGCLESVGLSEYLAGRYENAIATIGQINQISPYSYACLAASYAQLGQVEDAQKVAAECVDHEGECAKDITDWHRFWNDYVDFRDQAPVQHLIEGLDKAGLVKH
ncbi:MAG: adenylate class-3/4/guanylyl cyclase [Gammaproteobacteria bacterium]|nr:MAG: adenylate class-3/4/guanylyl cyclase [Gammaproteobacteria bacterium]